jgi:hypothetical protein
MSEQTLGEYALNADGRTFNGPRAIQWMLGALAKTSITEAEARKMILDAQQKAQQQRAIQDRINVENRAEKNTSKAEF